jgi:hypothetical protein
MYINSLKSSGNYMYHLTISNSPHFLRRVYLWVSYDSQNEQRLFT